VRALILTAIGLERQAVLSHISGPHLDTHPSGTIYTLGRFDEGVGWDVAIVEMGAGNSRAATESTRGCEYFTPDVVMMVGVAGGLKDVQRGDVVAASRIDGYESGKEASEGFAPRPTGGSASYRLEQCARAVRSAGTWTSRRRESSEPLPRAYIGPIVSGEKVVANLDSSTARLIRQQYSEALAVDMEGIGVLEAARQADVTMTVVRGISDLIQEKAASDAQGWQEVAAENAAAFAFEMLASFTPPPPPGSPPVTAPPGPWVLPPIARPAFVQLQESDAVPAARLLAMLAPADKDRSIAVRDVVADPPDWLNALPYSAWVMIANIAAAYNEPAAASTAAERAAGAGAAPIARWVARAALFAAQSGDMRRANDLAEAATAIDTQDTFVRGASLAIAGDLDGVVSASSERGELDRDDALILDIQLATALRLKGRDELALRIVSRLVDEWPDRAAPRILFAQLLAARALGGRSGNRAMDLMRARFAAREARDLIRAWDGDSSTAVAVAAEVAMMEGETREALRLTLSSPAGEATLSESSSPDVVTSATRAALEIGNTDLVYELLEAIQDPFERTFLAAQLAARDPDDTKAAHDGFRAALHEARTVGERADCLYQLARLGDDLSAELEAVQSELPEAAEDIRALSEFTRGERERAIGRWRLLQTKQSRYARHLARAHDEMGDTASALDALRSAAQRFSDPTLLRDAVALAYRKEDYEQALHLGEQALVQLPSDSFVRRDIRWQMVETANRRLDWQTMETHARALVIETGREPLPRWALALALFNQNRYIDAWSVISDSPPLEPIDEYQARIKIELLQEFHTGSHAVAAILELAERFDTSEEFLAASLFAILNMRPQPVLAPPLLSQVQRAFAEFVERFPNSTIIRALPTDNVDRMVETIRGTLELGDEQRRTLAEEATHGRMPFGLLAAALGRPYALTLLDRGPATLVAHQVDPSLEAAERSIVQSATSKAIVLDTSALSVAALIPTLWDRVRSTFHELVMSDLAVSDVLAARRLAQLETTAFMGLNPADGRLQITERSPEDAAEAKARAQWMAEATLDVRQVQVTAVRRFPQADMGRMGNWLGSLELAEDTQWALYADDVALRSVAREIGIPAFDTVALLSYLVDAGLIDSGEQGAMWRQLVRGHVVDLPDIYDTLTQVAAADGWTSPSVLSTLGRPAFWVDPSRAVAVLRAAVSGTAIAAPPQLAQLVYAAGAGGLQAAPASGRERFLADLVLLACEPVPVPATRLPEILDAVRLAARTHGASDPLPATVVNLIERLRGGLQASDVARYAIGFFGALGAGDRMTVMRLVLGEQGTQS
jgi:nucleoside phosphorylase/tetratricopeptide (TPR) repeat protein